MPETTQHAIYDGLNKPLLILGVDRWIFVIALFGGMICYWFLLALKGLATGAAFFAVVFLYGRWSGAKDQDLSGLIIAILKYRIKTNYDAGTR